MSSRELAVQTYPLKDVDIILDRNAFIHQDDSRFRTKGSQSVNQYSFVYISSHSLPHMLTVRAPPTQIQEQTQANWGYRTKGRHYTTTTAVVAQSNIWPF